jgi:glucokinase-like ROK family protein
MVDLVAPAADSYSHSYLSSLVTVLDAIRSGRAHTRPQLVELLGLGRNVVTHRVAQLLESGLVVEGDLGVSTGGRAPRELRFDANAGMVVAAELGATSVSVAVCDLAGVPLSEMDQVADITDGPQPVLTRVVTMARELIGRLPPRPIWGVGVGLPGPVEFASGQPVAPPIMPGWDGYPVRDLLAEAFDAPVWVDNDVNVMALGEHRAGIAQGERDFIYCKIGSGIGAGVVSNGQLTRGAQGCAGDIGHIAVLQEPMVTCRCGRTGCLEAVAGGVALQREGLAAARDGRSAYLMARLKEGTEISARDVGEGAAHGDAVCAELLRRSGHLVGDTLASLVNVLNPSMIVIGGGVSSSGDAYLAAVREAILRRSLPLATRDLRVSRSPLSTRAGLFGAAFLATDELFAPARLAAWINERSPAGKPEIAAIA